MEVYYTMSDDLRSRLQAYYAEAFPARQNAEIGELACINAGWESDVYAFAVDYGPARARRREELILRIYPGNDAYDKSEREFRGMMQLHQAGYPVPEVLVLERENSPFGQPFVLMERIRGREMWPLMFDSFRKDQQALVTLFCELYVRLHALDWRPFADDVAQYRAGDPFGLLDRELTRGRAYLQRFPVPGFSPVLEWLEARHDEVPCHRPAVVHGDFHPANMLWRDDGSAVVIDWTSIDVSDARFDLAWTLLLIDAYEDAAWRGRILEEYERLAGVAVEGLEFFDVFACLRRLFSVMVSVSGGAETLGMRPGAEEVMKQQAGPLKRVYDLLLERTGVRVAEVEKLLTSLKR
jgi:aminoglycoside phosphotransferase (APT) family kinase protein